MDRAVTSEQEDHLGGLVLRVVSRYLCLICGPVIRFDVLGS